MSTLRNLCFIVISSLFLFSTSNAHAATLTGEPPITQTSMSASELQSEYNCVQVTMTQTAPPDSKLVFTYTDGHHHHFLRSIEAKTETPQKFTVEAFLGESATYDFYPSTFSCSKAQFANITSFEESLDSNSSPTSISGMFATIINFIFDFIDSITKWTLDLVGSKLILIILQQGKFITNDIVVQGWPFIQGLANLGFIFALLYIALATTLRMESVSTSVQRLLPKLLIGALLVNFSLVIGGLVIDASRLVMAVELTIIGGEDVADGKLVSKLIETTKIYESTTASIRTTEAGWQGLLLTKLKNSILKIALSLGLFIIALNLFIRYIVLIILLIFSPIAYLAIAFPQSNIQKFFGTWWAMFLKWVAYGPIVLFFMILITKINSLGLPANAGYFAQVAQFCVVIALLYAGNIVAKKAAGMGSDAVMGFAKKNPRAAFIAGTSLLTGGLGGGIAAAALTSRSARDAYKGAGDNIRAGVKEIPGVKQTIKTFTPGKRDKSGNLLPGQNSIGATLASTFTDRFNPKKQDDIKAVKALMPGGVQLPDDVLNNAALTPSKLKQGHVVSALGDSEGERNTNIKVIIENGSQSQRMALAQNKDYIASLSSNQMAQLQQTIGEAAGVDAKDRSATIDRVMKTVEELNK